MPVILFGLCLILSLPWPAGAETAATPVISVVKVADGIYALIGPLGNRTPRNLGNNATFGAVVTDAGVVLVDSGGTAKGAAMLEAALATVTEKPVVAVINTGGQDHRWLGNGYFKARGARLIASAPAVADQRDRLSMQLTGLEFLVGADGLAGTEPVYADETFSGATDLTIGGVRFHLRQPAPAHTPGDSFVWLPGRRVLFSGDIVYGDRLLAVIETSNLSGWIEAFGALAAFNPGVIVPGHGRPTDLAGASRQTLSYLVNLRSRVRRVIAGGGGINEAVEIDQSAFKGLQNFDLLARRNAQTAFQLLEFE